MQLILINPCFVLAHKFTNSEDTESKFQIPFVFAFLGAIILVYMKSL